MERGWLNDIEAEEGWVSGSNVRNRLIRIGTDPTPVSIADKIEFGRPTHEESVRHRIIHELGHFVLQDNHGPALNKLEELVAPPRDHTGGRIGMSGVGSLDFYRNISSIDVGFLEGQVELLSHYVQSPARLEAYLAYLSDSSRAAEHARYRLATLMPEYAELVYDAVGEVAKKYIVNANS